MGGGGEHCTATGATWHDHIHKPHFTPSPSQLKVQLAPNTPRTCIGFEATVKDSRAPLRGRPRLTMFEHRHGALVYESQVEPYLLPNGRSAFFYFDPGDMHDEVPVKAGECGGEWPGVCGGVGLMSGDR